MCLGAIYWARLAKIYYANTKEDAVGIPFDGHFIYQEIDLPPAQRTLPTEQMLRNEALVAFERWMESTKKVEY